MKLHEIAEQKALKVAEMRSLLSADKLNAEGQAKFDALKTQVTDLEGQEARAKFQARITEIDRQIQSLLAIEGAT